jgi:hypothetical protein
VYNTRGIQNGAEDGKMRYIYSSSGDFLIQLLISVGYQTQNGPACSLQNHMLPHERQASRRDYVLAERTVYDAGHCLCITYHFYCSDLMHLGVY